MGKGKDKLPDMIFGGSGKDWFRFGNVVVNDSKEGWDSLELMWDVGILITLIIAGVICFFCGLIFLGIVLAAIGIWGFASKKAFKWITTIITWGIFLAIALGVIAILGMAG